MQEKKETLNSPSNLEAHYDKNSNSIEISWRNHYPDSQTIIFVVTYTVNNRTNTLATVSGTNATLSNPQPGQAYVFKVVAFNDVGTSEPASVSVTVESTEVDDNNGSGGETNIPQR